MRKGGRSGPLVSGRSSAAVTPDLVLFVEQAREPALLLNEGAVRLRHARIALERREHVQRRFGVIGRAVRVFERNTQPLRDLGQRAAFLRALQLARPNQRIDPFDIAAQGPAAGSSG